MDRESPAGKHERPNARRSRNLHVFFLFAFWLSIAVNERANKKQKTQHESRTKSRRKIDRKLTNMDPKSTKNRGKIDAGRFWGVKVDSGTDWDVLGTVPGRQKAGLGLILGRPGRAKSAQEQSQSVPGPVPGRSWTVSERCPSACKASRTIESARGTIFGRFCIAARRLGYAFRISFYDVLLASGEVSSKRTRAP